MRIAVDAMGGDKAPRVIVEGAILATEEIDVEVILVGKKEDIQNEISKYKNVSKNISLFNADEKIDMNESPVIACRQKKDSSIMVSNRLVAEDKADAVVSAGNTGASLTSAFLSFGRVEGIIRPAIAALFPSVNGKSILLDVGANVDCKPKHLLQFGIMGVVYAERMLKIENPRVGLLSIGEEESKGNEVTLETSRLLKSAPINYIGNVEGRDILSDKADVIVCDGFLGNIILKFGESIVERFYAGLKIEFTRRSIFRNLGALLAKPVVKDYLKKKYDYSEYGAAPLLGLKKTSFISHGGSSAKAIKNAIKTAAEFIKQKVNLHIEEKLKNFNHYFNQKE